ncbi:MAG: DUF3850 domain-containing protein [archaeon]|jgi:hypothetical protein
MSSKIIEKKVWPEYFTAILAGDKNYELRLDDFKANKGDTLVLKEWNPKTKKYTGREIKKIITWIGKTKDCEKFWPKEEIEKYGFQVLGFK